LDPLNTVVNRAIAHDLGTVGRDEEALAQWNRALELEPDHAPAHLELAVFHFERGRAAAGSRHLERADALALHDSSILAKLAIVHALIGNGHEARRRLGQLTAESARRYVSPVLAARVHAALGEADRAFALLEDAYAAKDPLLIPIQVVWDIPGGLHHSAERAAALRSDPRFDDLVRRMGFVPRVHAPRPR
jgi:tetratricopeptide (TPR) repeat protein